MMKSRAQLLAGLVGKSAGQSLADRIPATWAEFAPLVKIRSGKRIIPFIPYDYQIKAIEAIEQSRGTLVLKSRQLGLTESISSWMLWRAIRSPGYLGVVLSRNQTDTSNTARRVRRMIQSLQIPLASDSLTDLSIAGGGRVLFRNSTPNGCRGLESVSDLFFDEAAFVDRLDELYSAALPSTEMVGEDARIIMISTPGGRSGFFYDRLVEDSPDLEDRCEAIRAGVAPPFATWLDDSGWSRILCHWKAHPIYNADPNYLESIAIRKKLPRQVVGREYDLGFSDPVGRKFRSVDIQAALEI